MTADLLFPVMFALSCSLLTQVTVGQSVTTNSPARGILLQDLTWIEAEKVLRPDTVVVIPLGAACKEHGPHLKLNNDWAIAEYLKDRVLAASSSVVVAPTISYSFYPAFLEYPGSISLRLTTARDLLVDVCHCLARYGPRRFYILNTGLSTIRPLQAAQESLAKDGVLLRYTNPEATTAQVGKAVCQQEGGTHADEAETSMMLYMARGSVDMAKAVKDFSRRPASGPFRLTRTQNPTGVYSPTGVWGDPTLATVEKGRKLTEALVESVVQQIEELRCTPITK